MDGQGGIVLALVLLHLAGAEVHGRILALPNLRGDDVENPHNALLEIVPLVIPVHGQEQCLALAHLHEFTQHRIVLRQHAVEDVVDLIAGMEIGGSYVPPGPSCHVPTVSLSVLR